MRSYDVVMTPSDDGHWVLKSEADKVIADLEESHKMEVEQLLMEIVELKGQYKDMDVTHTVHIAKMNAKIDKLEEDVAWNKYKRCLAMAQEWRNYAAFCGMQSSCHNHRGFGKTAQKYDWKEFYAWKCVHRYKELAKEFKREYENGRR